MTIALVASGTQTASEGVEHTLATETDPVTYVLVVDTAEMVLGDVLELRLYTKCLDGGTSRLAYIASYTHVQGQPNKYSVPVPADIELKATLKQVTGSQDFPWALLSV